VPFSAPRFGRSQAAQHPCKEPHRLASSSNPSRCLTATDRGRYPHPRPFTSPTEAAVAPFAQARAIRTSWSTGARLFGRGPRRARESAWTPRAPVDAGHRKQGTHRGRIPHPIVGAHTETSLRGQHAHIASVRAVGTELGAYRSIEGRRGPAIVLDPSSASGDDTAAPRAPAQSADGVTTLVTTSTPSTASNTSSNARDLHDLDAAQSIHTT
jgi:hypothetical protein